MFDVRIRTVAKARVTARLIGVTLHDKAHDAWRALREADMSADSEADCYDCELCGATMHICMENTHEPDCPYEVFWRAIDVYDAAVQAALSKIKGRQLEEAKSILADTADQSNEEPA